jgi:serine/threonine protein kinase/formylglycine-generating enzyme required for sulfatase activity
VSDRFRRIEAAFHAAREVTDPAERERIIQAACAGDEAMLAELRAMLTVDVPTGFLEPEPPPPPQQAPQQVGEFELESILASGPGGVVWIARQPSLDRKVAVKVLTAGPGTPPAQIDRFHRESRAVSLLTHPHIVPVLAEGQAGVTHWFAMQFVDGHSLAREIELQRTRKPGDPAPLLPAFGSGAWFAAVARLCADAADALHLAHGHRIVHRDVKPHNLLLDQQGNVLVGDFGIARDQRFGELTDTGVIIGTAYYMSPEQAHVASAPIDHRTDIYSLGVVLYELLTLTRPFDGTTSQEVFDKIRHTPPPPVSQRNRHVPRDLETICMAAISRLPGARYQSAVEMRDDLRRFLEHRAILRQPPTMGARLRQWAHWRRRPLTLAATALVVGALTIFGHNTVLAAERHTSLEKRCRDLLATENLDVMSDGALATLWADIRAAGEPTEEPLRRADARLRDYRDRLVARGQQGLADAAKMDDTTTRLTAKLGAWLLLRRAEAVDPGAPKLSGDSSQLFLATIAVTVVDDDRQPVPATIAIAVVDPMTTLPRAPTALGSAPLSGVRLSDGLYRIIVHAEGYGDREFPVALDPMERRDLELRLHRVDDLPAGMKLIPAGDLYMEANGPPTGLAGKVVAVPSFWLDACEVTVAEYREFVRATNHPAPPFLDQIPATHDRRPITQVTWEDAVAYATWRGKRLPTLAEWMLAARGPGPAPRALPWTKAGFFGNCRKAYRTSSTQEQLFRFWLEDAADVDADPDSCTPEGVFELFGNVDEWSESVGTTRDKGGLRVQPQNRFVVGEGWSALSRDFTTLTAIINTPTGPTYRQLSRGFRCARSTTP